MNIYYIKFKHEKYQVFIYFFLYYSLIWFVFKYIEYYNLTYKKKLNFIGKIIVLR